jgi:8-oxo-dGTP pyrophosphatase MutT (NUDIX family)
MTSRQSLVRSLESYVTSYPEEAAFIPRFQQLLQEPGCFERHHLPGHITGSAWIVNEEATKVVMVKHGSLHKWLQPGGHADGDENTLNTATREAREETGLTDLRLIGDDWFDLDIHGIPEKKSFPAHDHYDVRFLFVTSERNVLTISDESTELRWVPLDALEQFNHERAVLRLREKAISSLQGADQRRL